MGAFRRRGSGASSSTAFGALPLTRVHAWAARSLVAHHRDPFDRRLVAQAGCERAVMLSADPIFAAYGIETVW